MSEDVSNTSNQNKNDQNASGDDQNKSNQDMVSYDSYKKVLGQYKNSKQKIENLESQLQELSEFKDKFSEIEEAKLKEEGNWTKLLEQREEKIKSLNEQMQSLNEENSKYKKNLDDMIKLNAFTNAIDGKLKKQEYYNFIDTDRIVINPETGTIDEDSLSKYANEFTNSFKELISFNNSKLPNDAPGGSQKLTYEEWRNLPLEEKKKRQGDVQL